MLESGLTCLALLVLLVLATWALILLCGGLGDPP